MDALGWLQEWFSQQCDCDWEHGNGIRVETIDNPGWRIRIDCSGTELQGRLLSRTKLERSEADWLHVWVENDEFNAACGTHNLTEALERFRQWARGS
jgi:hypothetical protein